MFKVLKQQSILMLCGFLSISLNLHAKITAEAVLGEYWKDPLFGEAAASQTIYIEILNGMIWPNTISVNHSETIRFVFINKSSDNHMFAFAENINLLLEEDNFQAFVKDEVFHAEHKANADPRTHSHASSSVDDAQAIVKLLSQRPTVFIKPDDIKEILIRFEQPLASEPTRIELRCVISSHQERVMEGILEVLENE